MLDFKNLEKASNNFIHETLLEKLKGYGIWSKENYWFYSFHTTTKQYVFVEDCFSQTKVCTLNLNSF